MLDTLLSIRLLDLIDILLVSTLIYRILLLIRGTRAMEMLLGLTSILLLYFLSARFELQTLHVLLKTFLGSILLVIVILFQTEIRRGLTRMGKTSFLRATHAAEHDLEEIVRATSRLAKQGIGALIVIENSTGLRDFVEGGHRLDARIRAELLLAIFHPSSPMHDGGVIIHRGRIHSSGCLLPLSQNTRIDKRYGTRHRAALGLSEETDAAIIVVSEETRGISLVRNGKIVPYRDEQKLLAALLALFLPKKEASFWSNWMGKGPDHAQKT